MEIIKKKVSNENLAKTIYEKIYRNFIESIDGIDNGVTISGKEKPLYKITTDLSARVGRFNTSKIKKKKIPF